MKITIFWNIIFHSSKAFKEISKKPKTFLIGAILLGLIVMSKDIYWWRLVKPFYQSIILYPIFWIVTGFIFYFFSWLFNKKVKFLSIFICVGYIATINIIIYLIGEIIGIFFPLYFPVPGGSATLGYFFIQSPFNFILLSLVVLIDIIWNFILYFFTIKEINKFKTGKTLLVVIIGGIVALLLNSMFS